MSSDDRFRRVYAGNFEALLAYASRRVGQPADAADVVSETFLVAWRRSDDLPPDGEVRLWLYGVARRVPANHHRGGVRRKRLSRARARLRELVGDVCGAPGHVLDVLAYQPRRRADDRRAPGPADP